MWDKLNEGNEEITEQVSEGQSTSDNESKQDEGSNTEPKKSEKKFDVWKAYKELKKENRILKATYEEDEDSESEEQSESEEVKEGSNKDIELKVFLLENPEAKEYWDEIKQTLAEFPNMSFDKAFAFSKANYTKSETTKDFSTKSATPKKELKDYSKEEILALKDNKKLLEWSRLQGRIRG